MSDCSLCARPCPDAKLCRSCLDQLTTELRSVEWLVQQLTITLTRQSRVGDRNGRRGTETPLVFHLGASIDLETLRDGLHVWATAVAHQRGITVDAAIEPTELALWLLRWAGEVAQHEDAAELHGDILAMTRACRRTIDLAPELRYVGPCDGHRAIQHDTIGCGKDLYASMSSFTVRCNTDGCDAEYNIDTRRIWLLEAAYDRLLTAAEMSRAIGELVPGHALTPNRISQWASRGLRGQRLTPYLPHPRDPHLRTRFRVEEVITFLRSTLPTAREELESA